jgi:pimeloyl-ACP methyl ester carboxylesterase
MTDIRVERIGTNGISLHVAQAGRIGDPLLLLLHGFPEYWETWRDYMTTFAAAGFHVVVPDQRGYNLSDKPSGSEAYDLDRLGADVVGLADHFERRRFTVVGHDWGGAVGWWIATFQPERLESLVVMNAPHPSVWREAMRSNPAQRRRSRYVALLRLPWLPELLLRRNHFAALVRGLEERADDGLTQAELDRYRAAWAAPGALTAMINWYRAFMRRDERLSSGLRIKLPVLLIWGEQDPYGVRELAEDSLRLCENGRCIYLPGASHWVHHDARQRCCEAVLDFVPRLPHERRPL